MTTAEIETNAPRLVFVVEDDREIRETLALMLNDEGYRVRTAVNGRDALTLLDDLEEPGVILLDLMMPVMDGSALLNTLRDHPDYAQIPVVILSAGAVRPLPGARRVIRKPVDFNSLLDVVREYCGCAALAQSLPLNT